MSDFSDQLMYILEEYIGVGDAERVAEEVEQLITDTMLQEGRLYAIEGRNTGCEAGNPSPYTS